MLECVQDALVEEQNPQVVWRDLALSVAGSQTQILSWIMHLHNGGVPFELDATYSKGNFYRHLPEPLYKYDLIPQGEDVVEADARSLPHDAGSINSVVFDPPFVMKNVQRENARMGIIEGRFSGYGSAKALYAFYSDCLAEFYRIIAPDGILVFKCQDTVSGGKQHLSHVHVINMAQGYGFYCKDLFVLLSKGVIWSPNMKNQQHARKAHSYFLVFKKPKKG
jgi:hypothetical protein